MEKCYNEIDPTALSFEARIDIIIGELISLKKSKREIIEEYSKKWNVKPSTIRCYIQESYGVLASYNLSGDQEQNRIMNSERLEELFKDADINQKIKIIDLLNKMNNLYTQQVNVKTDDEIKIDLGV